MTPKNIHGLLRFLYVIISVQVLIYTFLSLKPAISNTIPNSSQITEARQQYESGKKFFDEGNLDKACESFQKAIDKNPHFIDAYIQYGNVLMQFEEYDKAEEMFRSVIKEDPKNAEVYYQWGNLFESDGQYEKAIEKYKDAIKNNPEYAEAYLGLGKAFFGKYQYLEEYDEAIGKFEKAIKLNPHYEDAYFWLLRIIYKLKGEKRKAKIADFQKELEVKDNETRAMVYYLWGKKLFRQRKYNEAFEKYQEALQIKPEYADVYYALAIHASLYNNYNDAIAYLKEAIGKDQDISQNDYYKFTKIFYNLPKEFIEKAIKTVTEELEKKNASLRATAINKWGQVLLSMNRYKDAIEQCKRAISLKPDYAEAHYNLGNVFYASGEYEKARDSYLETIKYKSEHYEVYSKLGITLLRLKKYEDAIEQYKKAMERNIYSVHRVKDDEDSTMIEDYSVNFYDLVSALNNISDAQKRDEYEKEINTILETKVDFIRAYVYIQWGNCLEGNKAINKFCKAIEICPYSKQLQFGDTWEKIVRSLGILQESKREKATEQIQDVLNKIPASFGSKLYTRWGRSCDDNLDAIEKYKKAIEIDPNFSNAYFMWGYTLFKQKKYEDAIGKFSKVIPLEPNKAYVYDKLGDSLYELGRYHDAFEKYKKGIEIDPEIYDDKLIVIMNKMSADEQAKNKAEIEDILERKTSAVASYAYNTWGEALYDLSSLDFCTDEFTPQFSIEGLCKVIDDDKFDVNLKAPINTVEWLNELLRVSDFYDILHKRKPNISFSEDIIDLVHYTKGIRNKGFSNLEINTQNQIIRLNRLLIEEVYPQQTPNVFMLKRYDAAIERYKKSLELKPDSYLVCQRLGDIFYKRRDFDEAIKYFTKAIEINPEYYYAYQGWGDALCALGKHSEAIEKYQKAIDLGVDVYEFKYNKLINVLEKLSGEDKEKEIVKIENVLKSKPYYERIYFYNGWGKSLFDLKKYDEAIEIYKNGLNINPNSVDYSLLVTIIDNLSTDELKKAEIESIDSILQGQLPSISANAYNDWGNALYDSKNKQESIEKYKKAIKIQSDHLEALCNLGETLSETRKYAEADRVFLKAMKINPDRFSYHSYYIWGNILFNLEQYEESIQKYKKVIELKRDQDITDSDIAVSYYNIGLGYFMTKKYDMAIENFKKATELDSNLIDAYKNCAHALFQSANYHEALKMCQIVLEKTINTPHIENNKFDFTDIFTLCGLIFVQIQGKERENGIKTFQSIIDNFGEHDRSQACYQWGTILYMDREYDDAERILKEGHEMDPNNIEILSGLIDLCLGKAENYVSKEKDDDGKAIAYKSAWVYYEKAVAVLNKQLDKQNEPKDASALLRLCEFHLKIAEDEKALKILKTIEKDEKMLEKLNDNEHGKIFKYLGSLQELTENQENKVKYFKKAAEYFEREVKKEPGNFNLRSLLAETYYNANDLEKSEFEYGKILEMNDNNADAYIGLGRVYLTMAEREEEGNEEYERAIEYCDKGITSMKNNSSGEHSKRELSDAYYLRGCAKVKMCKSARGYKKDNSLLPDAQCDFESCFRLNPDHYKSKRAREKIADAISLSPYQHFTNRLCPWMILGFSVIIFLLSVCKLFFIKSDKSSTQEGADSSSAETGGFFKKIFSFMVGAGSNTITIYVTLIFAAFLAVGFVPFLPQISKMKFGGLEVEKESVEQKITSKSFIDIEKGLKEGLEIKRTTLLQNEPDIKTKYTPPKLEKKDEQPNRTRSSRL